MVVIDFVRHAQGFHNLCSDNLKMPDPLLTSLGEEQCATLQQVYGADNHAKVRLLVSSPLRRTLQTTLLSFAPVSQRGVRVLAVPELQEVSAMPSDVGTPRAVLEKQTDLFPADRVDLSRLHVGWTNKGPGSPYAFALPVLAARAKSARRILRDLTKDLGADDRVVVVTHGGFLHFLTEDYEGVDPGRGTAWKNTEWRSYEFVSEEDDNVSLKETTESVKRRAGSEAGLTTQEQIELAAVYHGFLASEQAHWPKPRPEDIRDYETALSEPQEVDVAA
ncbi:hypothetical protein SPBR_07736 [Sporothrix brasiliensis 5110]|uniref:Phosphoglycerate mutase family protein n=1 Tax=Sporothrix brasiliensis 5110 TaxID=1398154 RepID=A0A0C2ITR8_9PEZI|nr:uncharacterized protein SPBR_07736 [Sporothrix brasiliensis 5110]KIH88417.1 hypothetical protein SPBR_07736 [Sporothrix brasiliensis 5110]